MEPLTCDYLVTYAAYVKAHRDAIERDRAREALVAFGLGQVEKQVRAP